MNLRNLTIALFIIFIWGCNDRTLEQLNQRNEELAKVKSQRDSILNNLDSTLSALERNLGVQEGTINNNLSERIKNNIASLEKLIQDNDKKVRNLRAQNQNSSKQNKEMLTELETSQQELMKRQDDLEDLNRQISQLDRKIKFQDSVNIKLGNANASQGQKVDDLARRLNTAYVIVGKFKELREKELVEKKGGFLNFLGREPKLDPDYNKSLFATINIKKDTTLDLNMAKDDIKFITVHPTESFELVKADENKTKLSIKDPERFWEASKFLVIEEK